jgi:histidyl-tRNA synthetase
VDVVRPEFGLADAEAILVLTDALAAVGLKGFEVRLNSRKVLRGLIESYGIDPARETDVLTALDKFDKIGEAGVAGELRERGLADAASLLGGVSGPEEELRQRLVTSEVGRSGLEEVDRLIDLAGPLVSEGAIRFSPMLARGLSYYTGPIFEIYVEGSTSAISSGGRYDGLVGMFAGRSIPAVGGSLGIERITGARRASSRRRRCSSPCGTPAPDPRRWRPPRRFGQPAFPPRSTWVTSGWASSSATPPRAASPTPCCAGRRRRSRGPPQEVRRLCRAGHG